jgi:hypothetical protein
VARDRGQIQRLLTPDFIGIGAMRSGTTWLVRALRTHPDVWMSRRKEVHFFDRRIDEGRIPLLPSWEARLRYAAFFAEGRIRRRRVTGEITPEYAILDRSRIELVHRWMPDVQLVFVMRDPVERGWSHIRKDASEPRMHLPQDPSIEEMQAFLDHPDIRARGDYVACIARWTEFFPPERFCFLFLEDIERDPAGVLRDLALFLDIDPDHDYDAELLHTRQNTRPDSGIPPEIADHLRCQFAGEAEALERLVGRRVPWAGA